GILLFLPVLAWMVYVNYTVDPTGIFHGEQFAREAVELLLQGQAVANYDALENKTRTINEALILNSERFDTIVIGSSRAMLINADVLGTTGSFLNMGVIGGDFQDLYGSFYLCVRENKVPSTVVLCIDPWTLNYNEVDFRSIEDWYLSFTSVYLGTDHTDYTPVKTAAKWQVLLDPAYFQGAIAYQNRDQSGEMKPVAVAPEELYEQTTTVKLPDGTIIYDEEFRNQSPESVESIAAMVAKNYDSLCFRIDKWEGPSAFAQNEFARYIDYMIERDIRVVLVLTPYHPTVYDALEEHADVLPGPANTQAFLYELAARKGIEIYGSYNPYECEVDGTAFHDHFHMRQEALMELLAPMRQHVYE
ncbi:hypothetical protein LJB77_02830, partial [Ruminococcaceae bacterium OttesenSCG-928-N02]|nr:hypothetical protein [Ruminococcaceae bacterium OttesenSCG-928-N02]